MSDNILKVITIVIITNVMLIAIAGITGCGKADTTNTTGAADTASTALETKPGETDSNNAEVSESGNAETDVLSDSSDGSRIMDDFDFKVCYDDIQAADISSHVSVHDPSILAANGKYYIFGSHMAAAQSDDLTNWKKLADGYSSNNPVYGQIYDVKDEAFKYAGFRDSAVPTDDKKTHVWAPDVYYNEAQGLYYMYYCCSSTWNASNLCFGTSDKPEGPYTWQSTLICSGFTKKTIGSTNISDYMDETAALKKYTKGGQYNFDEYPNAIDPTVFDDADGNVWMVYGSWSGGIFIIQIDPETGLCIHPEDDPDNDTDSYFGKKLLGGGHISIEGPWIQYDENSGYYYLYVSYGGLNTTGGYQIRVFRSKNPDGPYEDMNGERPGMHAMHQNFGLKLSGNYKLPSLEMAYMATGHNSAFHDADGRDYIVFHTRFNDSRERHSPRVHQLLYNEEGWPCMLPYQTQREEACESGYSDDEICGRYFAINQGTDINSDIANPFILYITPDGQVITKDGEGIFSKTDGTYYMHFTLDGKDYSGAFCAMKDEAGTDVMCFSAVGCNESIWGVKYE